MEYKAMHVKRQDDITWLVFNRPEKKNAMNPTLHREMHHALSELDQDDDTRVLVITGNGDSFSAGEDLKEYFYELKDKPGESERIRKIS